MFTMIMYKAKAKGDGVKLCTLYVNAVNLYLMSMQGLSNFWF